MASPSRIGTFVPMLAELAPADAAARPVARGRARRERIVEAALTVIAERGPDALTHRRVAAAAGVPLAATTYWFDSKEQLIREALEHAVERDLASLAEREQHVAGWTRATFAREYAGMLHGALTDRREAAIVDYALWLEAVRRPGLRALAERWSEAHVAFVHAALRRVAEHVAQDDARLFAAAIDGLVAQALASGTPAPPARLAALIERLLELHFPGARA